jgi:hypothetical protein
LNTYNNSLADDIEVENDEFEIKDDDSEELKDY